MSRFQPPRATRDFTPDLTAARERVRAEFARVAESYGFQGVQTPIFEREALFSARSGPEIKSSMLTFHCDHEEFALRPEMTAPVCRLIASGALDSHPKPYKLYYVGSCFRYCRPQPGRYREFTQAGIECMGESGPEADAEVIAAACRFLRNLGIGGFKLKIGNIGIFRALLPDDLDAEDRAAVIGNLDQLLAIDEKCGVLARNGDSSLFDDLKIDRLELATLQASHDYHGEFAIAGHPQLNAAELAVRLPHEAEATFRHVWSAQQLVTEDRANLLLKVSRLRGPLGAVDQQARALLQSTGATDALDRLLEVCHLVESYDAGEFDVDLGISRGLAFYTSTVFEISASNGNGSKLYCGGGRYDRLVEEFGGPSLPSAGCAFRFDDLVDEFIAQNDWSPPRAYQLFLLAESKQTLGRAIAAAEQLRRDGLAVGVAVGPQANPTAADCANRNTDAIGLCNAASIGAGTIQISDGKRAGESRLEAPAIRNWLSGG